jgi:hydroxymethylbilane synthase
LRVKKNFYALDINFIVPSVGQGSIALVGNKKNTKINKLIKKVNDEKTFIEVSCEREFLRALDGSCKTPIGAYAEIKDFNRRDYISLFYYVSSIDGKNFVKNKKNINLKDYLSESYNLGEDVKRELKL